MEQRKNIILDLEILQEQKMDFLQTQNGMNVLGLNSTSVPANTQFTNSYTKTIASQAVNNVIFNKL